MRTRVLVLCTGNAARSQMAEGLLRSFDPLLEVCSAGTHPAPAVHPAAIAAMAEIGIDSRAAIPKSVTRFLSQPFDFVITVCDSANATCPVFAGDVRRRVHMGFDDPSWTPGSFDDVLDAFRRTRDLMKFRLGEFFQREIRPAMSVWLRRAEPGDLAAAMDLLRRCDLPAGGLADQFGENYVVAESRGGMQGLAGIEIYGQDGLLRSVAVAESERGEGLGKALVDASLRYAKERGLNSVYLLTTTASAYFARLGFAEITRPDAPAAIRSSPEFAGICPSNSKLMRLALK